MSISVRLAIIILIFIAILAVSFTLVWPKYQDFQSAAANLKQKEAELNSKTAYYSKIKEARDELKKYENILAKVDSAIPEDYSAPVLFNYLQKTASDTGLVLENLAIERIAGDLVKQIDISLKLSGNYSSLKNFISAVENSERFFEVKNVNLSSGKEKISFNLEISTYSY